MRTGPGKEFPIKFEINQKGYPLKIIAEFNNWRKVKTRSNLSGWIHTQLLSSFKTGLIVSNTLLKKRPLDTDTVEKFITKITRSLEELGQNEISSNAIGKMVMDGLKNLDPVAYVRFASVYRNFREEKDFVQFVDKIDVFKKR